MTVLCQHHGVPQSCSQLDQYGGGVLQPHRADRYAKEPKMDPTECGEYQVSASEQQQVGSGHGRGSDDPEPVPKGPKQGVLLLLDLAVADKLIFYAAIGR